MKRIFLAFFIAAFGVSGVFASETTGSIDTAGLSTGLQFSLPCNPASVTNGSVNTTTCVITCNSGYSLSGNSCVAPVSSGGGWSAGGGGSSFFSTPITVSGSTTSSGTVTSTGTVTTTGVTSTSSETGNEIALSTVSAQNLKFTDLSGNWAKSYVETLALRGIINNAAQYRPEGNLTRAEFLKIVGNSSGWKLGSTASSFTDVKSTDWYASYVAYAVSKGIISSGSKFRPNDTVTRAEVAKILIGSLGKNPSTSDTSTFVDVSVKNSLFAFIESARENGIFEGQSIGGSRYFRPNAAITRAEIAKVVVKAMGF